MSRLAVPARESAPAASQPRLDAVETQLGSVPNLYRLLGPSPAAPDGVLALSGSPGRTLDLRTRDRIALATAKANGCDHGLSAHGDLGAHLAKLDGAAMALNRQGRSGDPKADAALAVARKVAPSRDLMSGADLAAVRLAGHTDAPVVEIVANVAPNVLANLVNNVAPTDIDVPVVRAAEAA